MKCILNIVLPPTELIDCWYTLQSVCQRWLADIAVNCCNNYAVCRVGVTFGLAACRHLPLAAHLKSLRPSAPRQITVITCAEVCQRFLRYDTLRYDIIQYDTLWASVSVALVKFFKFIANNRIRFIRFIRFIHIIRFIRCAVPRRLNLIYVCFVFLFFFCLVKIAKWPFIGRQAGRQARERGREGQAASCVGSRGKLSCNNSSSRGSAMGWPIVNAKGRMWGNGLGIGYTERKTTCGMNNKKQYNSWTNFNIFEI